MAESTIKSGYATILAIGQRARPSTISGLDLSTGEARTRKLTGCPTALGMLGRARSRAAAPYRFAHGSGPCGFQPRRDLEAPGRHCEVIAVTSIPRGSEDRALKDDGRDAEAPLSEMTKARPKIKQVWMPDAECEGLRDLTRAYEDAVSASRRSKLWPSGFLLRHGTVWDGRTRGGRLRATWGRAHADWLKTLHFGNRLDELAFGRHLEAAAEDVERARRPRRDREGAAGSPRWRPYVDALTRLRCVDVITALAFCATMGDLSRFGRGRSVSRYLGLTPGRHGGGPKVTGGGHITKAGDARCRRAVIEGAASVARSGGGREYCRKGHGASPAIEAEAARRNTRDAARYAHLIEAGRAKDVAKTAVASMLARDMWFVGTMVGSELAAKGR